MDNKLKQIKDRFLDRLHWKVLTSCNLNCDFCYLWREPNGKTLDIVSSKKLIDEASQLFNWILFGGGDPLIHPDILELVLHAKNKKLKVEFQTNAKLINREIVPELFKIIDNLGLSIDGDNSSHDKLRKAPGNFEQQLMALDIAEKNNVHTTIRTLVTKENVDAISTIPQLLSKYNCIKEWRVRQFIPLERGLTNENRYSVSDNLFADIIKTCQINVNKLKPNFKISVANANQVCQDCCIHISHDGTVYGNPESTIYKAVGSFPNQSLKYLTNKILIENLNG